MQWTLETGGLTEGMMLRLGHPGKLRMLTQAEGVWEEIILRPWTRNPGTMSARWVTLETGDMWTSGTEPGKELTLKLWTCDHRYRARV